MDYKTQHHELATIHNEYKDFFVECQLKLNPPLLEDLPFGRPSHLYIRLQDDTLRISVNQFGWYLIGESQNYETFETLMMQKSSWFSNKFHTDLLNKLNNLDKENAQEYQE